MEKGGLAHSAPERLQRWQGSPSSAPTHFICGGGGVEKKERWCDEYEGVGGRREREEETDFCGAAYGAGARASDDGGFANS